MEDDKIESLNETYSKDIDSEFTEYLTQRIIPGHTLKEEAEED